MKVEVIRFKSTSRDCVHLLSALNLGTHRQRPAPLAMFSAASLTLRGRSAVLTASPMALLLRPSAARGVAAWRAYASLSPDSPPPTAAYDVFDEAAKARQKDRSIIRLRQAAAEMGTDPTVLDYLREEVADRICERVEVRFGLLEEDLLTCPGLEDSSLCVCGPLISLRTVDSNDSRRAGRVTPSVPRGSWCCGPRKEALGYD